jgi:hypothetical protein
VICARTRAAVGERTMPKPRRASRDASASERARSRRRVVASARASQ